MNSSASADACPARATEVSELRRILPTNLIEQERHAAFCRWPGYGFMGAMECTLQFARDYEDAYRLTFGVGCKMRPELGSEDFEILWQMRQAADDMMISYPLYLDISFHQVRRKDHTLFDHPHLVFERLQKKVKWLKYYRKRLAESGSSERMRVADLPQYHLSNDLGLPLQKRFRRSVSSSKELYRATNDAANYGIQWGVVSVADALGGLSEDDRRTAIERLKTMVICGQITRRPDPAPIAVDELVQTCFGWIGRARKYERCDSCVQRNKCLDLN